jgi:hypothetical protein
MAFLHKVIHPLNLVALFATLSEASAASTLPLLDEEARKIYVWFLVGFPSALILMFFLTLNFNHTVLNPAGGRPGQAARRCRCRVARAINIPADRTGSPSGCAQQRRSRKRSRRTIRSAVHQRAATATDSDRSTNTRLPLDQRSPVAGLRLTTITIRTACGCCSQQYACARRSA